MTKDKPNIILIMSDQLRHDMLSCYGHPSVITPNLDKLAERGTQFTDCYSTNPVCLPSRTSIKTGQYCHDHGCHDNSTVMNSEAVCFPALLRDEGYFTAAIGKLHLWEQWEKTINRADIGFEYYDTVEGKNSFHSRVEASRHYFDYLKDKKLPLPHRFRNDDDYEEKLAARVSEYSEEDHVDSYITTRALNIIEESGRVPFFMQVGICSPHEFYDPPQSFYDLYENVDIPDAVFSPEANEQKSPFFQNFHKNNSKTYLFPNGEWDEKSKERIRRMRRHYLATVSFVDYQVGRIIEALKDKGIYENTAIIFISDHGEFQGDHGCITKSMTFYECNVHVPLMIHAPFLKQTPGKCETTVQNIDLFATILDMANIPKPSHSYSQSLIPALINNKTKIREKAFAEYFDRKMIKKGRYKLIHDNEFDELYDLILDPMEQKNLAILPPETNLEEGTVGSVLLDLTKDLINWCSETEKISHLN